MTYDHLEPVIGLEIHVQLKTKSKLFSGSNNSAQDSDPNTLISAIDVGHPGTLPNLNREALHFAARIGLALNSEINSPIFFDRKHYIYPDLPKGYQISQFDVPVVGEGYLDIEVPEGDRKNVRVRIERAHLEEDAAKNIHRDGKTLVDFNRAGTPLVEIVTRPDLRSPQEAKIFLTELRRIMRYLGVSDADMEKGHLRCDANISMRPVNKNGELAANEFYPKTEVKNMNSFRAVERALVFEIERQTDLWQTNSPPATTTTRGWDANNQKTEMQRTKELAADYRFMREPDIPPIDMTEVVTAEKNRMPELPAAKRARFKEEFGFSEQDTRTLTDEPAMADFTEATMSELVAWLVASPDTQGSPVEIQTKHKDRLAKLGGTWIATKLVGVITASKTNIHEASVTPEDMAELMKLVFERKASNTAALTILETMIETGKDPHKILEEKGLGSIDDEDALTKTVETVLANNPAQVEEYKAGKITLMKFFIGMVQKETQGAADPPMTQKILDRLLK